MSEIIYNLDLTNAKPASEELLDGVMIYIEAPQHIQIPWDAGVNIGEDDRIVMHGSMVGVGDGSDCMLKTPKSKEWLDKIGIDLTCEFIDGADHKGTLFDEEIIKQSLEELGWVFTLMDEQERFESAFR